MPIESVRCAVSGAQVTRVTDFEGAVTQLICPEYEQPTGTCRLKKSASSGGPLARLLERAAEHSLDTRSFGCVLAPL
jgi:hypothetical protein